MSTIPAQGDSSHPPLRIGIAGLGTVGASTVSIVHAMHALLAARAGRPITITAVSARDAKKDRGISLKGVRWENDPIALARAEDVDVVVELIGGSEGTAKALCEEAIANKKHVVTANKALIAEHGLALVRAAEHNGVDIRFEAAVTGAIPIVQAVREGLAANTMQRVVGIMNGTCNFMLTAMEKSGSPFNEILKQAQELGYAEADPSFDIDGVDTAHKLAILASIAFGTELDFAGVHIEGIRDLTPDDIQFAKTLGYRIKLLGIAQTTEHGIEQRVHPCLIEEEQPMARIPAEYNAVETHGEQAGKMFFEGKGAGGDATASAVIADIIATARGGYYHAFGTPSHALKPADTIAFDSLYGNYYVRLVVVDRPGVLSAISNIFYKEDISVKSCIQHSHSPGEAVPIVIITHNAQVSAMRTALAHIQAMDFILEEPHMIRIENL